MKPYQNSVHSSGSHTRALAVGLAIVTVLWQGSASGHQMDGRVFVFCVEKDGSNLERVSGELTGSASGPTWAPDGKRILYELFDGKTSEFRVVSRDGSKNLKVQLPSQVTNPGGASWSPDDGAQIVFSALTIKPDGTTSHSFDIYTMELGASQETTRRIVRDGFSPVWSPDGRRIAFVTARDGNFEVYTADRTGLHVRNLSNHESFDMRPSWSPDGSWIAFQSTRYGESEICIVNADGGEVVNVSNHPARDEAPSWSPDGLEIAFASNRSGSSDIYRIAADGSAVYKVTQGPANDREPAWSPDGRSICFVSNRRETVLEAFSQWIARPVEGAIRAIEP